MLLDVFIVMLWFVGSCGLYALSCVVCYLLLCVVMCSSLIAVGC